MAKEIERKFRLKCLPENLNNGVPIRQGYLKAEPNDEVRVRQKGSKFYCTSKSGKGICRIEFESPITAEAFNILWRATEGARIEKTRYIIKHQNQTWEVDDFHSELRGLVLAEVELPSQDTELHIPPEINELIRTEVTLDEPFKNKNLAKNGLPA